MNHPKVEFFALQTAPPEMIAAVRKALGPLAQPRWLLRVPLGCRASEHLALNLRDSAAGLYPGCTIARVAVNKHQVWVGLAPAGVLARQAGASAVQGVR